MEKEYYVNLLKNRELRELHSENVIHPSGKTFEELSFEEMQHIQGAGDVQADTSPLCFIATATLGGAGGLGFSIMFCNKGK